MIVIMIHHSYFHLLVYSQIWKKLYFQPLPYSAAYSTPDLNQKSQLRLSSTLGDIIGGKGYYTRNNFGQISNFGLN